MTLYPAPKPRSKPKEKKRTPVKRSNAARSKLAWLRAYGSRARVNWVTQQHCLLSSCIAGPSQNAHTGTGGMGRKGDANTIVPLCSWHHRMLHQIGAETFARRFGVDLKSAASEIQSQWQAHQENA